MRLAKLDRSQFAVGVATAISLVVIGGLVWGFSQQVVRARQMRAEELRLEQTVADEQVYYDSLVARLKYVQSDAYVEQWARKDAKMAKPGEVVVVVSDELSTALVIDITPVPTVDSEPQPFWVEWWELIFSSVEQ
ncbi:MAG: hypothetical protein GY847_37785 [Proteobacteria bacterium]|nr:hypothetical protein [Pseudomonadota bacterium]